MSFLNRDTNNFDAKVAQAFTHDLQNHPLMQFEELKKLALRHPMVRYHSSNLERSQKLDTVEHDRPNGLTLQDSIDNIETSGTFIFIQNIQTDPIYGPFVNSILDEISEVVSTSEKNLRKRQAWVFITSPGGVTPYHRDQEAAHYFHIKGKKSFWLWNASDRDVVSQEENEFFHGSHGLLKTNYAEAKMTKATQFNINPGDGIYFPYTAPHMVENGKDEFAISFSVTHMTDEDYRIKRVNKINQLLRKIGLMPKDMYESTLIDSLKLVVHYMIRPILFYTKHRLE